MYESPIEKVVGEIQYKIIKQEEENILYEVEQSVGYSVDKEELIRALNYDRDQYRRGYSDGLNADKWISVSERLPEESKRYLVATKYKDVMTDFYTGEMFLFRDDVIAWMPLPEPYEAESEDDNEV